MANSTQGQADSAASPDTTTSVVTKPALTVCPVCNDTYADSEPKMLPCAHRFCRKCLLTWFESCTDLPTCPICKRKAISPSDYAKIVDATKHAKKQGPSKSAAAVTPVAQATGGKDEVKKSQATKQKAGKETAKRSESSPQHESSPEAKGAQQQKAEGAQGGQSEIKLPQPAGNLAESSGGASAVGAVGSDSDSDPQQQTGTEREATVPEAVVDALPMDTVVAVLAESTRKLCPPHVCSVCPGRQAACLCLQCWDLLCPDCSLAHSKLKATRSHEVREVAGLTAEQLARQAQEACKDHAGQQLALYCPTHAQLMCLLCFAVSHSQCQGVQTLPDAAARLRQVLQSQVQQVTDAASALDQTSADIHQKLTELSDSQARVSKDIASLVNRITTAASARHQQLLEKAKEIPRSVKTDQQQKKEQADELRWLLSANQQLVVESLQNASDASFLHVFGSLMERMKELVSRAAQKHGETSSNMGRCVTLSVDQYDVLRIEELLRGLGEVEIVAADEEKSTGPQSLLPPVQARADSTSVQDFDPFLCRPREIGEIQVKGLRYPVVTMCKGDNDLLYTCDRKSLFSVCTSHPFKSEKLSALPYSVRCMAYIRGELVMTTDKAMLLFLNVTKHPKPVIRAHPMAKVYRGITHGLEDTIIVSSDGTPCTLDILNKQGQILRTLSLGHDMISHCLCCLGDFVIVSEGKIKRDLVKVALRSGKTEWLRHGGFGYADFLQVTADHKGRLYVMENDSRVIVMDLNGLKKDLRIINMGGMVVTPDGKAFTFHPSPPEDVPLLVFDLTKL